VKSLFSKTEMAAVRKLVSHLHAHGEMDLGKIVYDFNSPVIDIESIILRLEEKKIVAYRVAANSDLPRIFIKLIMKPQQIQDIIFEYGD
jgi:transcription initiation factor IIE alpha subunit